MKRCLFTLFFVLYFFVFPSFNLFSQENGLDVNVYNSYDGVGEIIPKHTFNFMIGLPTTMVNKSYKDIMKGVVELSPYYQYFLPNSLAFGVGLHYAHFGINDFRVPEPLSGKMHTAGVFIKVGYEKFYFTRFAVDISVKIGSMNQWIDTDLNDKSRGKSYTFSNGYIAPTIGFILSASEHSAYRMTISYAFQDFAFSPRQLGSEMTGKWTSDELSRKSQILTFSLGYTHYFNKEKQ